MENILGGLRIKVKRGIDLAIRDINNSDPYVVIRLGKHKLKTRVIKHCLNPQWNDDLTLYVTDPNQTVKLMVNDRDTFLEYKMGDAEFEIRPFLEAVKMNLKGIPSGTIITRLKPERKNCLVEESVVTWEEGEVVQNMCLRLRHVERGEVEVELRWTDVPGARGL